MTTPLPMRTVRVTQTQLVQHFKLCEAPLVAQYRRNGRRFIYPAEAAVTTRDDGTHHVRMWGPLRRKDRTVTVAWYQVDWGIGGLFDQSKTAPPLVFALIEVATNARKHRADTIAATTEIPRVE